jgi:hypothetical protein
MATCHRTTAVPVSAVPIEMTTSPHYHPPCGFTRAELMNAATDLSSDSPVYKVYFRPSADGNILCASCGLGVGYHRDAPTTPALAAAVYPATEVVQPQHDADAVEGVMDGAAVDGYRGIVYAGIAGLGLIFAAAALGTPVMGQTTSWASVQFTIWQLASSTSGRSDCTAYMGTTYSAWAFYILATIMTIIDIVVGFLSHFAPNTLARKIPYKSKSVLLGCAIVTGIFSGLAWILVIVMVSSKFCGSNPFLRNFALGASPILMIVVFLCSIGMGVVAKVMAPRNRNEAQPAP